MRRSELSEYIRETIVELLSEVDPSADPQKAKEYADEMGRAADEAERLQKALTTEDEDEFDIDDKEPSKKDLKKEKGLAKAKEELAQLIKKMKAKAQDYKAAEGDAKEKIKDELKAMTAEKKKLEKQLDV